MLGFLHVAKEAREVHDAGRIGLGKLHLAPVNKFRDSHRSAFFHWRRGPTPAANFR
jgi:hypothetical protein